jgi:hypothetical protein
VIFAPQQEWVSLCHLMTEMRRESMGKAGRQEFLNPLSIALDNPELYFETTLLPESIASVKSVFGI